MENFEDAIKDFVIKIDSVPFPTYVLKKTPRRRFTNIQTMTNYEVKQLQEVSKIHPPHCYKENPKKWGKCKIMSPDGIFETQQAAREFYGMSAACMAYHLSHYTTKELFYYDAKEI